MNAIDQNPRLPRTDLYVNGAWVKASSGKTIPVFNPATEAQIAEIAAASPDDVNRAVEAAHTCFESTAWRRMRPLDRGRLLERLALIVEEHADELARLETLDNGKPYGTSRYVDLAFTIDALRYFGGWASKSAGEYITLSPFFDDGGIYRAYTERKPVGVVGGITPWNFPLGQAIQKIAPAIAFGCTVVLKPSEETSLTTLRLAELIDEVGFPKGSVNIVTGYGHDAGAALVDHPLVRKIAFTGSTATGQRILAASAKTMKRVTLELGGKSPTIILADADLDRAIPGAANAIFGNSGQVCTAGSRLLIEEPVYEEVTAGVAEIARGLRLGPGLEEGTQLGPIVSSRQLERISGLVQSGLSDGARALAGGNRPDRDGWFFEPTVLADVRPDMQVIKEEIFGPVVCAIPFKNRSEIKAMANDTPYGLGASIWTRNLDHAHLLAEEIDAGTVWFNTHNILDLAVPFGGTKMSGLGREFGTEAINAFTEPKAVVMRLAGDY
ncbi:aldehyde dehydrogenase [Devosia sp. Root685]|uniref:aldehyde dehydrogenase family protein n=1 Tax=Devosia sp. Root685 TaxID=1736587 RepID=UPI0006F642E1|nr:aldehyde dehydrogenase family protein [Devosia sp. Root685]KRB01684.1 aldehyde dehydrogenase [Devosia sp. Root685]